MQEWVVTDADAGTRLDVWLARRTEAGSRRRVAEWLERGKVYLGGEAVGTARAAYRVAAGDRVGVWLDRPGSATKADRSVVPLRHLLNVVYTDAAMLVVNKPPGLIVEPLPGREGTEVTLVELLKDHVRHDARARLFVVHRIDRDTSGLVLFARTPAACDALKDQFEVRTPERVYQAVVLGRPEPASGTWQDRLAWDAVSLRQRRAHAHDARGKDAIAAYTVREQFPAAAVVEVSLVTGKRNQIRVQAALRGHPLVGEVQYRFDAPPEPRGMPTLPRQALHAWRLGFRHPVTAQPVSFTAPVPADFAGLVAQLRDYRPSRGG